MSHYCKECQKDIVPLDDGGVLSCGLCGLQIDDLVLQSGPTFVQDGNFSHMAGTIIREEDLAREGGAIMGAGRDRSAQKGKQCIRSFAEALDIEEANTYIEQATRLYQLAMSTGFTRGRRVNQVAAACLYVVLRQDRKPYLLIDFCKHVSVNVYVLGSTYLRLTETLRLSTHPVQVCLLDPSLYIHRFASRLFPSDQHHSKKQMQGIISTSMQLIASMKRDWMQTGRRPAGVCGAALFLACHIHGVKVSRRDIIKIVSVGESTILHRIAELRNTAASQLTLAEFQENAKKVHEYQMELEGNENQVAEHAMEGSVGRCRHVHNNTAEPLAFGLCQDCYKSYVRASGGNVLGAEDPPAYKRNLRKELKEMKKAANHDAVRLLTAAHPSTVQQAGASVQRPPQPQLCLPSSAAPYTSNANGASTSQAALEMRGVAAGPSQSNALVALPRSDGAGTSQQAAVLMTAQADGAGTSQQCTALVPIPGGDRVGASHPDVECDPAGGGAAAVQEHSTALVVRPADGMGASPPDDAAVALQDQQPAATETAGSAGIRRSGRLARKRGKPDTPDAPEESAGTSCTALVPVPKGGTGRGAGAGPSQLGGRGGDAGNEASVCEHEDEEYDPDEADEAEGQDAGKGAGKGKKGKRKRKQAGQQKRSKLDPSLEAEFALAMLENNSLREIVDLLKISRAELPAMSVDEARHLLAASGDPLAEAHAKRAQELQSIADARQEPRADDATLLRVARFLEVQNGTDLSMVSQPLARVITDDMQERARELEKQNAEPCDVQLRGKKARPNTIQLTLDGGFSGADGAEQQDGAQTQALEGQEAAGLVLDVAEGDAAEDDSTPGAVLPAAADNLPDLDDDELDQYLCTEEEVKMKKQIWMISNKDWLEAQEAKKTAAAAVADDDAPKRKKKPKKPTIQFAQGATAQESVERMFESKNLKSRVNQEMLKQFFESAEQISNGEVAAEAPAAAPAEPTGMAQHIKSNQQGLLSKQNAKMDKHQAALQREQAAAGGGLGSLLGSVGGPRSSAQRSKRPVRLGKFS